MVLQFLPFAKHKFIGGKDGPTEAEEIQARLGNAPTELRQLAQMLLHIKKTFLPLMSVHTHVAETKLKNMDDLVAKCLQIFEDLNLEYDIDSRENSKTGGPASNLGLRSTLFIQGVRVCTARHRSQEELEKKGMKDLFHRLIAMSLRGNYISLVSDPTLALSVGRNSSDLPDSFRFDLLISGKELEAIKVWDALQDEASKTMRKVLAPEKPSANNRHGDVSFGLYRGNQVPVNREEQSQSAAAHDVRSRSPRGSRSMHPRRSHHAVPGDRSRSPREKRYREWRSVLPRHSSRTHAVRDGRSRSPRSETRSAAHTLPPKIIR